MRRARGGSERERTGEAERESAQAGPSFPPQGGPHASHRAARSGWFDSVYDDFETICAILGIRLKTRSMRTGGGSSSSKPCIWFSGFYSQGDGACFEGCYRYQQGSIRKIRTHAPLDKELHRIADTLLSVQRRNFYQITAEVSHRGRYCHAYSMDVSVERDSPNYQRLSGDDETIVIEALRDLANWLYRQLEQEYEYLSSNEVVDEALLANAYTFTECGRRFG
ncbi:antitoxin of toxin-antitoxin stability system [Sinorhizobium meliloti]|uniref:Antitoxin of toxin-antitoxin stability system n=1 Tax=Rhizobium meliloti TaxID=382 RepID=A0A2J0YX47_RHIML|nr:antitoxin of toxin-antitoxin stability system [Sinorhizobium meliloti]PJR12841.1 antitoxin of toxin-antitoxin stability system [Sinorhizobium meliloti]